MATGEYVIFVDSDDWIDENMISILIETANKYEANLVSCGHKKITDGKHVSEKSKISEIEIYEGDEQIIEKALFPVIGSDAVKGRGDEREKSACMSLYSRKIIQDNNIEFLPERRCLSEDLFFNIEYILKIKKMVALPDCLYNYRYNPISLSNGYRENKIELLQEMTKMVMEILEREGIKEAAGYRAERTYFKHLRYCLMQVSASSIKQKEKWNKYKSAINHPISRQISAEYPCNRVSLIEAIMVYLIKKRWVYLLRCYLEAQRYAIKLRGWRN